METFYPRRKLITIQEIDHFPRLRKTRLTRPFPKVIQAETTIGEETLPPLGLPAVSAGRAADAALKCPHPGRRGFSEILLPLSQPFSCKPAHPSFCSLIPLCWVSRHLSMLPQLTSHSIMPGKYFWVTHSPLSNLPHTHWFIELCWNTTLSLTCQ